MSGNKRDVTLRELGEFGAIENVIVAAARRHGLAGHLGDDCGYLEVGSLLVAVSADVGPRPLVQELDGHSDDHEAAGWHAAVATASDISTAGAAPICLVDTIDAPPETSAAMLDNFVEGYFGACKEFGFAAAGGDIRQGPSLKARVFGMGLVEHGKKIGRSGISPGDRIALIGPAGQFVSAYLRACRNSRRIVSDEDREILRRPRTQLSSMRMLTHHGLIIAASDSSDGVLGALENLCRASDVRIRLDLDAIEINNDLSVEASVGGYSAWNLFFFWGDWSVAVAVGAENSVKFEEFASNNSVEYRWLGKAVVGKPGLEALTSGSIRGVDAVRNENFTDRSFNANVGDHVEQMLKTPIIFGGTK